MEYVRLPPFNTTFNFLGLPPEIRNMVYEIVLVNREAIPIASPRNKYYYDYYSDEKIQKAHTNFASILRVNKKINSEAKSIFYSRNIFIVSTGRASWGSSFKANAKGLQTFLRRVPKECISLIERLLLDVECSWSGSWQRTGYQYNVSKEAVRELNVLVDRLRQFDGVKEITVAAVPGYVHFLTFGQSLERSFLCKHQSLGDENLELIAGTLQKLLLLPALKKLLFNTESTPSLESFKEEPRIVNWAAAVVKRSRETGMVDLWMPRRIQEK